MWSNVSAVDAFSAFETEDGKILWFMGKKFLDKFLSRGGSEPLMKLYKDFRGREPDPDALMRQMGFIE